MNCITVPKNGKIIVCGDIHEHEEQLDKLLDKISTLSEMVLVSVGDIYGKGFGVHIAESIVDKFIKLSAEGRAHVIRGNHELKSIKIARHNKQTTPQLAWLNKQPLSLAFEFYNKSRLIVIHGGVKPAHTWEDLATDIELSYIRTLDSAGSPIKLIKVKEENGIFLFKAKTLGKSWHDVYDGRFGYIAAGHQARLDGIPKFYNYSCNLDTAVFHTGKLTAQVFSANGKEELFTFEGRAKYSNLQKMHSCSE
ncbi:MAG: metallophosphoesterase [bacterium]|nr:metallophosphoesterase [bacterium]